MRASRLTKGIVAQVELPTVEPRPGAVLPFEQRGEATRFEYAAFEDAIVGVDLGD